tara:strand:- start:1858 stop:2784 length:927 start_codon:yes stop_codon:yes gene_type:complete
MSGSMTGGVDASIPLQAGRVAPVNPLQQIGEFANVMNALNTGDLQKQAITRGKSQTAQTVNQIAYQALLPLLASPELLTVPRVAKLLGSLEDMGLPTGELVHHIGRIAVTGNPEQNNQILRAHIATSSQGSPESGLRAVTPSAQTMDVGGQILPLSVSPAASLQPGAISQSGAGFRRGFTPGEEMGFTTRPATQEDVDKSGGKYAVGQMIREQTSQIVSPGGNPGVGGGRVPPGALGPGGYTPPQRPLDQLGPKYQKREGGAAPPAQTAPPPAETPPSPGMRLMRGPKGDKYWVAPDKVGEFAKAGYK